MYFNGNAAFELFLGAVVQIAPIALGDQIGKIDRIAHETMDYISTCTLPHRGLIL